MSIAASCLPVAQPSCVHTSLRAVNELDLKLDCVQTVRRGNAARAQMASIMAAAVQAGYLSMVEGVIDGLDAMTNPCLPLKDPKAKFVCGPRHWNPLLVAEHYFDNMLPGGDSSSGPVATLLTVPGSANLARVLTASALLIALH